MFTFLLIVQTIIAVALISVILMQRSEGGGLGVGGSSSGIHDGARRRGLPDPFDGRAGRYLHRPVDRHGRDCRQRAASRPRSIPRLRTRPRRSRSRSSPAQQTPPTAPATNQHRTSRRPPSRSRSNFDSVAIFFQAPLASAALVPLSLESHGAVYFCHRRRGLIAWKRTSFGASWGRSSRRAATRSASGSSIPI